MVEKEEGKAAGSWVVGVLVDDMCQRYRSKRRCQVQALLQHGNPGCGGWVGVNALTTPLTLPEAGAPGL